MKDLTESGFDALSKEVFADDYFIIEANNINFLIDLCREEFVYTQTQLENMLSDVKSYLISLDLLEDKK